jgi:hypothetical protein
MEEDCVGSQGQQRSVVPEEEEGEEEEEKKEGEAQGFKQF